MEARFRLANKQEVFLLLIDLCETKSIAELSVGNALLEAGRVFSFDAGLSRFPQDYGVFY